MVLILLKPDSRRMHCSWPLRDGRRANTKLPPSSCQQFNLLSSKLYINFKQKIFTTKKRRARSKGRSRRVEDRDALAIFHPLSSILGLPLFVLFVSSWFNFIAALTTTLNDQCLRCSCAQ